MFFEKLFNKKIKFIYFYFFIIIFILSIILFGWSVRHIYEGGTKLKRFENIIINISSIPSNIKKLILGVDYDLKISSGKNFKEKGMNFFHGDILMVIYLFQDMMGTKKHQL